MLKAEEAGPSQTTVVPTGIYGAFRTTSAVEDSPLTGQSGASLLQASTFKDDDGKHLGLQKQLALTQTARNIPFFKVVQFALLMYLMAGSFFPNHRWFALAMANSQLSTQIIFLLSGIITHHRYRKFFDLISTRSFTLAEVLRPAFRRACSLYYQLRIWYLIPYFIAALIWALPLTFARGYDWSIRSLLSTLSMTSSLQTLYPFVDSTKPSAVILQTLPFLMIGQTLLVCWLIYPLVCGSLLLVRSFCFIRLPRGQAAFYNIFIVICAVGLPVALASLMLVFITPETKWMPETPTTQKKDFDTLASSSVWFINPLFKFPVFVCGVLVAELMHELRWHECGDNPERPPTDERASWFTEWVLPYFPDLLIFPVFCLVAYDPRSPEWTTTRVAKVLLTPLHYDQATAGEWMMAAPWVLLPIFSLTLFLFASPYAYRGICHYILCQEPIVAVLPGRTSIGITICSTLVLYTISEAWRDAVMAGKGIFVIIFFWFVPSIVFYYYVYQPCHLWCCIHSKSLTPTSIATLTSIMTPSSEASLDKEEKAFDVELPKDGQVSIQGVKVLTSPHYDAMYPEDTEHELRVYQHLANVLPPKKEEFWSWLISVFVQTHYVE
eukprot:Blabericola_migrator_1__550@NODE_1136_length_5316_cov_209_214517_g772_i0_p1_GENE_NODE_1136_length_5316_cov_209_214517_g772_i0NODE_1136_length_5316_cov_209_214517_g772_i0_p1_ORF_typecomplete_len609_score60_40_NODE_1136_length_5316_cov_209_214517_g772_i025194345